MKLLLSTFLTFFLGISCFQKDVFQSDVKKALKQTVNEYQTNEYQKRLETGNDDPTVS